MSAPPYAELRAVSAFSFLRSTAMPERLAEAAAARGYTAVACGDWGGVYGAPRFHATARAVGLQAIVAADLAIAGHGAVRLLVQSPEGHKNLCHLLTLAHQGRPKGESLATLDQLAAHRQGLLVMLGHCTHAAAAERVADAVERKRALVEVMRHGDPEQERRNRQMRDLARLRNLRVVATNDVRHLDPDGRRLFDALTCVRHKRTLDDAGRLARNGLRHLRTPDALWAQFADDPAPVAEALRVAQECPYTLQNLPYRFPRFPAPEGEGRRLRGLVAVHGRLRYGDRWETDGRVKAQLEHELALIEKLGLCGYFLIVWDISRFCRERRMLAQGRGSAANSAVCYALGITAVEPVRQGLLFERFLSEERGEWPDIDLDLPSGAPREAVIQYVLGKYGPRGAALCAVVTRYRGRLALRELGRVLGLPAAGLEKLAHEEPMFGRDGPPEPVAERLAKAGLYPEGRWPLLLELCDALVGLPRHLSQHPGGMILSEGNLDEVVPIEPAAMEGRCTIQWDKDDCEVLGLIKIDLLGLGMLSALSEAVETLEARGTPVDLAHLPEDPRVYAAAARADTVGVFQIESRAQMATLPRLQPRRFYDLVVSVGLIRPGPIVGQMVQPYLRRRMGREAVTYPHPSLQPVLERTLGIPLFQEQLMRLAMVAGGLSGGEAQELRKLMTRGYEGSVISTRMAQLITRLRAGMTGKGIVGEAQEQVVQGIAAFAQYGFPESHAMSWALMVYMSLFLKVHHPAVFLAALLNHQPMGFYAPDTLIQDAKRHGVRVEPACALESSAGCRVLDARSVRLGLQAVRGVGQAAAERLVHARALRPLRDVADAVARAQLSPGQAEALARAGAFAALGRARRAALWDVRAAVGAGGLALAPEPGASPLPEPDAAGQTLLDYAQTHATVGPHLVSLLRPLLARLGARSCVELGQARDGERVRLGGLVICRQRPQTAKGTLFLTVEDETGLGNGVVQVDRQAELRLPLRAPLVLLEGRLQARDGVHMVLVERAWPLPRPAEGVPTSHDFR